MTPTLPLPPPSTTAPAQGPVNVVLNGLFTGDPHVCNQLTGITHLNTLLLRSHLSNSSCFHSFISRRFLPPNPPGSGKPSLIDMCKTPAFRRLIIIPPVVLVYFAPCSEPSPDGQRLALSRSCRIANPPHTPTLHTCCRGGVAASPGGRGR